MDTKYLRLAFVVALIGSLVLAVVLIRLSSPGIKVIERQHQVFSCVLPPSYFVYQKRQNLTNKTATDINVGNKTKSLVRKKAKNKQKLISKEAVNSDCKRALELCKRDSGCYAKGCIELSYYLKGLCKSKSECLKRS
jgi:hypothetical protein